MLRITHVDPTERDRPLETTRTAAPASRPPTVAARKPRPSVVAHGHDALVSAAEENRRSVVLARDL